VCRWTTAKQLTSVLSAILALSDSWYKGWQPEMDDLLDIQRGQLYFVDKYGKWSSEEVQSSDEESDSSDSTSFENTRSLQSVPSLECSTSGSSSVYPSAESSDDTDGATPTRTPLNTTADGGITRVAPKKPEPVPQQNGAVEPLESSGPAANRPGLILGKLGGGPSPPDGRFFTNPLDLRTITTGTGDGYRSPEPPPLWNTFSPPRRHSALGGLPVSGLNSWEMAVPPFSVSQPVVIQPPNDPGLGMERGCGPLPPSPSLFVLPVELMVYNDLMVDIGTAPFLGAEMQEPGPPPLTQSPMPARGGRGVTDFGLCTNGYGWEGFAQGVTSEPPQTVPSFWYPRQDQPYPREDPVSAQQTYTGNEGQWPTNGIVDYK